jgi:hypothetical protein
VNTSSRAQIAYQKPPNGVTTWGYKLARPASNGTYHVRIEAQSRAPGRPIAPLVSCSWLATSITAGHTWKVETICSN